jgi:hypothetical protein
VRDVALAGVRASGIERPPPADAMRSDRDVPSHAAGPTSAAMAGGLLVQWLGEPPTPHRPEEVDVAAWRSDTQPAALEHRGLEHGPDRWWTAFE